MLQTFRFENHLLTFDYIPEPHYKIERLDEAVSRMPINDNIESISNYLSQNEIEHSYGEVEQM